MGHHPQEPQLLSSLPHCPVPFAHLATLPKVLVGHHLVQASLICQTHLQSHQEGLRGHRLKLACPAFHPNLLCSPYCNYQFLSL